MPTWTFVRLFADEDGLSRVDSGFTQELEVVDFAPPAPPMHVARASAAQAFVLVELPVGWRGGWHPSPIAQWVICLAGEMGYQAGDGTTACDFASAGWAGGLFGPLQATP